MNLYKFSNIDFFAISQVHHYLHYKKQRNPSPTMHHLVQEYAAVVHHAVATSKPAWAGTLAALSTARDEVLPLLGLLCTAAASTLAATANCSTTMSIVSTIVCGTNDPTSTTAAASSRQWQGSITSCHCSPWAIIC